MLAGTIIEADVRERGCSDIPVAYGRFLQADPVGPMDSPNLYQYVLNDPVNGVDPTGLDVWCGGVYATVCGHRINQPDRSNRSNGLTAPGERNGRDSRGNNKDRNKQSKPNHNQCAAHPILGALGKINGAVNTAIGLVAGLGSAAIGELSGSNPSVTTGNNSIQILNASTINNRA